MRATTGFNKTAMIEYIRQSIPFGGSQKVQPRIWSEDASFEKPETNTQVCLAMRTISPRE